MPSGTRRSRRLRAIRSHDAKAPVDVCLPGLFLSFGRTRSFPDTAQISEIGSAEFVDFGNDFSDKAVFDAFFRAHPVIAVRILFDPVQRLASRFCKDLVQAVTHFQHFTGLDFDIRGHAACATGRLMQQEAGGYAARFDGSAYTPKVRGAEVICAPDKDSWEAVRREIFGIG